MINRLNTELSIQYPPYIVEGSEDEKMTPDEIIKFVTEMGFSPISHEIWFDSFQKVWMWRVEIEKPLTP